MKEEKDKIVEVKGLTKFYGNYQALYSIDFDVYKGDVFGLLGPNGAGKSTTIRTLLSLIKPTQGEVKLFDQDLKLNRNSILSRIGCIIEKPEFYQYLSAEKNLEIFGRLTGGDISKKKIGELLDFVGLSGREKDKVKGFSSGMNQRLGIAQTLLNDPDLIVLDEPTTGLDPQGILDMRNLILQLKNEKNKTIILSSHNLSEIEMIANRMTIINKGKTIVQGEVSDLLNEQELIVSFTIDNIGKAFDLIKNSSIENHQAIINENQLLIHVSQDQIPVVNQLFCDNQIRVFSIEPKRKLEDYFLKLINN